MALTTVPASLSATALTLTTAAQPNITSVGTLTGLTVSGNIAGTLTTAAQTNITSVGTLSSLTIGGNLLPSSDSAHNIGANATRFANAYFDTMYGTVGTAAQPNITSVGTLTGLSVSGAATFASTVDAVADVTISNTSTNSAGIKFATASANRYIESTHDGIINIGTGATLGGGTKYVVIDGGNVGIGASPITWYANQAMLQLGPQMTFHSETTSSTSQSGHMSLNAQLDTDASWEYILSSNKASNYYQYQGTHNWRVAGAGTAGNDISWTTAMTIDNSGNVGIGMTPVQSVGAPLQLQSSAGYVGLRLNGTGSYAHVWDLYASKNGNNDKMFGIYDRNNNVYRIAAVDDGNIGIGTTEPAAKLHVMSGDLFVTANSTSADSGQGVYFQSTTNGWNTPAAHAAIFGKRTDASNGYLRFDTRQSGTTQEAMRIDNTGAVIVNDTGASAHKFKVKSSTMAARFQGGNGGYTAMSWTGDNGTTIGSTTTWAGLIYFGSQNSGGTGSNGEIRITPTAANILLLQSNGMKMHNLSGQSTKLELVNVDNEDTDTGRESSLRFSGFRSGGESVDHAQISGHHFSSADDDNGGLIFWTNNGSGLDQAMRLTQQRRLGIGTDAPIAALSVKGTSVNTASHLLHVYRPDGLTHHGEPYTSILLQNQESTSGHQYDGIAMMALNQTHLRFQVGNNGAWNGSGNKRWQLRVGEGSGLDRMEIYSWNGGQMQQWDAPNKAVAIKEEGSRFVVGGGVTATTFYSAPPSEGAIGLFCKGSYSNCDTHMEIATSTESGWSPIYLNKFNWTSGEDGRFIAMGINGFGTDSGKIQYNGTDVVLVQGSDYRLKENIVDYTGGLAKIEELRVRSYNKKEGVSKHITQEGFIAHEAAEANIPGFILGEKDAMKVDEAGETVPDYQQIARDRLIPYLVSAIQELSAEVKALKAKVGE